MCLVRLGVGDPGVDECKIVACILVGRVKAQGTFVGKDGIAHLAKSVI